MDICICGKSITESTISKLNIELNENLPIPYYFDIIYYDNIKNDNLRNHIDTEGKVILCKQRIDGKDRSIKII